MRDTTWPGRAVIPVRQADLGRDGAVSTLGVARWLEDARLRLRMRRFEAHARSSGMQPFRILLVGQQVERLSPHSRAGDNVEVVSGVSRIGRSSFTYLHEAREPGQVVGKGQATIVLGTSSGPMVLPDQLIDDLQDLAIPGGEGGSGTASDAQRHRDHYPWWTTVRTRVADLDSNRHVNFQVLLTWYEEAVAGVVWAAGGAQGSTPSPELSTRRLGIEYAGEVTFPGDYQIGVRVSAVLDDAIQYELAIFGDDRCLGTAQAQTPRGSLNPAALPGIDV